MHRNQNKNLRVVVFAGAGIRLNVDSKWVTKTAFANYLNELLEVFDRVVFIARIDTDGTAYSGVIDDRRIEIIPVGPGRFTMVVTYWRILIRSRSAYMIIFFPNGTALMPIWGLLKILCRKIAVYYGNDYREWLGKLGLSKWPLGDRLYSLANSIAIRSADVIFARGKAIAEGCAQNNDNVIETIPLGYMHYIHKIAERSTYEEEEGMRILYLGVLSERKGLPILFKAITDLSESVKNALTLDIVGDGPDREKLKKMASEIIGKDNVLFHGWLEGNEVESFWEIADILVVPSLYAEGVPRVIDEAIIRRVPVVSSCVGGIGSEFSNGEVYLVESGKADVLGEAISKLLTEPDSRNKLIDAGEARRVRWQDSESAAHQHAAALTKLR